MYPNLDIERLRTLVAIADSGSFSHAARQVGRTQSAISLQIQKLEQQLGVSLLERRQGRVLGLTEAGTLLLDYARRLLGLHDEACAQLIEPSLSGSLRLGLPEEFMERVGGVINQFRRCYPRVRLELRCDLSARLRAAVQAGELDLALLKCAADLEDDGSLVLRQESLHWMCNAQGSALEREQPLPLVLFVEGCAYRRLALTTLRHAGLEQQILFQGHSYAALLSALRSGLGISALPLSYRSQELRVCTQLPELPAVQMRLYHASRSPSALVQRLAEALCRVWQEPATLTALAS